MNGGSPPPYIASPRVDPRLAVRGGTMHVQNKCRRAVGDCWRKLSLIGPNKGLAEPFLWPFGLIFGRCIPCGLLVGIAGCIPIDMWVWHVIWALGSMCALLCFVGSVFSLRLGLICFRMWPSNSRARVECSNVYFSLCMSMVFTRM